MISKGLLVSLNSPKKQTNEFVFTTKGLSVNEDYNYLWAVHSFDVETFEFSAFCFCYSAVNVGSVFTEAQPGSTLTALCFEIACLLLRKNCRAGISNFNTNEFFIFELHAEIFNNCCGFEFEWSTCLLTYGKITRSRPDWSLSDCDFSTIFERLR